VAYKVGGYRLPREVVGDEVPELVVVLEGPLVREEVGHIIVTINSDIYLHDHDLSEI